MISKRKILPSPFFLFGLIAVSCLVSSGGAGANKSRFSWLELGSYATHSFGLEADGRPGTLGFDDCCVAAFCTGNYTWRCIEVEDNYAKLEVEINLTLKGVSYIGREFVERAENGDLSFIKRIPMEQVIGRTQTMPDRVYISGAIHIHENLVVTVDLDTMELVDENCKPWGKWVMWIDPLKYPLEGETPETFIMNWLNTTVDLYIHYHNGSIGKPIDTVIGKFERFFVASRFEPFENEFLLKLGIMKEPQITMTYAYEPRSGILLQQLVSTYLDDILTQKLGIILTSGTFILSETNVSIDQDSEFDFSPFIPYLVILGISAIIAGAYLIKIFRKRK